MEQHSSSMPGLLALVFLYNSSASLYNNTLPLLIVSMGLGPVAVSLASFTVNAVFILLSPRAGRLGDSAGRKVFLMAGSILLLSAQLTVFMSGSYRWVLVSAGLAGAAGALFSVNATMAVVEAGSLRNMRPEKPLASVGLASGGGWFAGMIMGGRITSVAGLRGVVLASMALSTASLLTAWRVPRTPILLERVVTAKPSMFFLGVVERVRLVYAYLTSFRRPLAALRGFLARRFNAYLLSMMTAFTAVSLFFTQIPVYMRVKMGLSEGEVFTYLSIHSGVSTAAFTVLYRVAPSLSSMDALLESALAARAAAFILPMLLASLSPLLVSLATFLVTGATWSMISVSMNSVALEIAEPARRGEKIGQLNSATSLGILLGSVLSGVLAEALGFSAVFIAASGLMIVSLIMLSKILAGRKTEGWSRDL